MVLSDCGAVFLWKIRSVIGDTGRVGRGWLPMVNCWDASVSKERINAEVQSEAEVSWVRTPASSRSGGFRSCAACARRLSWLR